MHVDLALAVLRGVAWKGYTLKEVTDEGRELAEQVGLEELLETDGIIPGSVVLALGLSDKDRRKLFKSQHCESVSGYDPEML